MANLLSLFLDYRNKQFVFSENDPTPYTMPPFTEEDILSVEFTLLKRVNIVGQIFQKVPLSGYSLTLSIGDATTVYAQASSFTATADGFALQGYFDLSTSGITALAEGATAYFETKLTTGNTVEKARTTVTVQKGVATSGALTPVAGDTALGRLEANRVYVPKVGAVGDSIILKSAGGVSLMLRAVDDGSGGAYFEASPIT